MSPRLDDRDGPGLAGVVPRQGRPRWPLRISAPRARCGSVPSHSPGVLQRPEPECQSAAAASPPADNQVSDTALREARLSGKIAAHDGQLPPETGTRTAWFTRRRPCGTPPGSAGRLRHNGGKTQRWGTSRIRQRMPRTSVRTKRKERAQTWSRDSLCPGRPCKRPRNPCIAGCIRPCFHARSKCSHSLRTPEYTGCKCRYMLDSFAPWLYPPEPLFSKGIENHFSLLVWRSSL
jgi:hypothetical protein